MPSPVPPEWRIIAGSCKGASHAISGKPNQDALACNPSDGCGVRVVACVADGHGDGACFRSDVGANLAVAVAVELGGDFLTGAEQAGTDELERKAKEELAPAIVNKWIQMVQAHALAQPFSEEELAVERLPRGHEEPLVRYGATLTVALLGQSFVLILQLGDGDAFAVSEEGNILAAIEPDEFAIAGETSSLCLPDAADLFRVQLLDPDQLQSGLVVLATDGYGNSFADPHWQDAVGGDLVGHLRDHGADWIEERLETWLADSAAVGGDDVSVVVALRS